MLESQVLSRIERTGNPLKCNPKFGHWVHTKTTHFVPKTTQIILENGYIIHGGDIIQNIPILYRSMLSSYCFLPKHTLFSLFPFFLFHSMFFVFADIIQNVKQIVNGMHKAIDFVEDTEKAMYNSCMLQSEGGDKEMTLMQFEASLLHCASVSNMCSGVAYWLPVRKTDGDYMIR